MFCCIRPPVEPLDRMITDIYKEYKVNVEALSDTQSAHATVFVSDDRVYKYEWLTEKAERRLGRVLRLEHADIPHIIESFSTRVTRFGVIYEYKYYEYGDLFHAFKNFSFTWTQFDHVCTQMVTKLLGIHRTEYCHHDIKPENLFLDNDLNVIFGDVECMSKKKKRRYGTSTYQSPMHHVFTPQQADLYALAKSMMVLLYFLNDKSEEMTKTVESAETWLKSKGGFASFTPCSDKWVHFIHKATIQNERGFNHTLETLLETINDSQVYTTNQHVL